MKIKTAKCSISLFSQGSIAALFNSRAFCDSKVGDGARLSLPTPHKKIA